MSGTDPVDPAVSRLLDDPALWAEASSGLRDRVLAEALGDTAAGSRPGPGGDELARRRSTPGGGGAGGPRRAWARPALVAAAVVVVLGIAVAGGLGLRGGDEVEGTEIALAGTEEAPGAEARAVLRGMPAGVAVRLDLEGLPPAPEGTFYEAWLVGAAGKVSAGTFHARGEQDDIELWLGVEPGDYDAFTVTRQPVDGGTLAEGVVVMRGELPEDLQLP